MKVELSNGYVILKDVLTRKINREYVAKLFNGSTVDTEGRSIMSPVNYDIANEHLVLSLVEKAVVLKEGEEQGVLIDHDWIDNLPNEDWNKIEKAALTLKNKQEEQVKK